MITADMFLILNFFNDFNGLGFITLSHVTAEELVRGKSITKNEHFAWSKTKT